MRFNVNNKVRVRLTDHGRDMLKKDHDVRMAALGNRAPPYIPPRETDGWSEWQLWDLMESLGHHVHLGCTPPFETEIEIITP